MALPVRFVELGIINPSQQCTANNSMAEKTTAPPVALILQQSHSYPPEVKAKQLKARKDSRTIRRQQEKEAASELKDKLPVNLQRAVTVSVEKGVSS